MSVLISTDGVLGNVAKMADRNPEAAAMLVQLGIFEALAEQIETVRTPMTKAVLRNMGEVSKSARRQLERTKVSKGEVPDGYEQSLDVLDDFVSKGLLGVLIGGALAAFNREHPRDDKGRFVTMHAGSKVSESATMDQRHDSHGVDMVRHRDQMKNAKLIDDDTIVHVGSRKRQPGKGKHGQEALDSTVRYFPMKAKELETWMAAKQKEEMPVEFSVRRQNLKDVPPSQLAAIDLAQLATGEDFMGARKLTRGLFDEKKGGNVREFGDSEARNWHGATEGTDRQAYRRIKTLGQGLSQGAPTGHPLNTVGNLAQLMGDIGPEAEKVLGPGIRRTAYRYRGTERRPEAELYGAVRRTSEWLDDYNDRGKAVDEHGRTRSDVGASNIALAGADGKGAGDYAAKIAATYARQSLTDDERDLRARGGVAVASLLGYGHGERDKSRLPDMQLTELSLASGEVPPSEGVIINDQGHVVSQAVGYNGDHYLPFDLRNLGQLYGGQYVRTRASGGPTTEDIYTALVTGTRQIQVVSNSGVFTIEFDPDLRGVRRFNDKVARMVERYGSMLEAIHDPKSQLYENDLDPATMGAIREEVGEVARSQEDFERRLQDEIREARWKSEATTLSWEEIEAKARSKAEAQIAQTSGGKISPKERESMIEELKNELIDNETPSVRKLRLNGTGYFRAMRALQQEFPYYIRNVDFRSLPEWLKEQGLKTLGYSRGAASDRAYVAPGQTNTAAAMVGGARSARRVKTGRQVKGLEAAEETYGATRRGQQQKEATPQRGEAAPGGPGETRTEQAPRASGEDSKIDYAAFLHGSSRSAFGRIAQIIKNNLPSVIPENNDPDDAVMRLPGTTYAHRIFTTVGQRPGVAGQALTNWMDSQDDEHRAALLEGVRQYFTDPEMVGILSDANKKILEDTYNELVDLDNLGHPYAPDPQGEEPEVGEPADKPFNLPIEMPARNAPDAEWEQQAKRLDSDFAAELDKGKFVSEVSHLAGLSREARAAYVSGLYEAMKRKIGRGVDEEVERRELVTAHRAWAFVQNRANSKKWRDLVGDAGPKVTKADSSRPAADPFLLGLRAELDQMIADGLAAG